MASIAKKIIGREIFALGGLRLSSRAMNIGGNPFRRAQVPTAAIEDPADTYGKGPASGEITMDAAATSMETRLLEALAADNPAGMPFTRFPDADIMLATPAPAGSLALLGEVILTEMPFTGERGGLKRFTLTLPLQDKFRLGSVLHSNVGMAALTASGVGTVLNLGALGAGQVLTATFHVTDPPGIVGTTPSIIAKVRSDDADAFTTPVDRITFTTVTTTPTGFIVTIDGDVTPITDTRWRLDWTIAGTGPQYTVMSAIAITAK